MVPTVPWSWCRMMASATASAWDWAPPSWCWIRFRAMKPPWNSNESWVAERFSGVVPMSWRRQVKAKVEGEREEAWEGNCWQAMIVAVFFLGVSVPCLPFCTES